MQLDQDYYAPRIVQIAGAYPGLTDEEFAGGHFRGGSQIRDSGRMILAIRTVLRFGTVAIEGGQVVQFCEDPVAIIAEHESVGIELRLQLPNRWTSSCSAIGPRKGSRRGKFLVFDQPGTDLQIGAFPTKADFPGDATIMAGRADADPWLPAMKPTKSGFMEEDEYF